MKLTIAITPELRVRLMHAQTLDIEVTDCEIDRDSARLDFLDGCVMTNGRSISAERDRAPFVESPTHGDLPTVTLFTVPSQHVRGTGLRDAIDAAMIAALERAGK